MDEQACARCGRRLLDGRCPLCSHTALGRFVHHEITVLITLCVIAAAGFLLTRAAARAAELQKAADADTWFRAGARALDEARLPAAVSAFRRASSMDRGRREYRLELARALAMDGQDEAARALLTQLRAEAPEDPAPNLALARLEARHARVPDAVASYRRALYGSWQPNQLEERQRLRVELIRYLLQRKMHDRALAELLVLATDVPEVPEKQIEAAELLLDAGDAARARALFVRALRIEGQNTRAIAGAARAALDMGDFAAASRLLRAAETPTADITELRTLVDLVHASDPLATRISAAERRRRIAAALSWAADHAGACQPPDSTAAAALLAEVQSLQLSLQTLSSEDLLGAADSAVLTIGRLDDTLGAVCPAREPVDRAWVLVARRHDGAGSA